MADPASWTLKHPVQTMQRSYGGEGLKIATAVTLRAYEVYCECYGEQDALMDMEGRGCRGGFGMGELVAFLYARSFPREEWKVRVEAVFKSMENW